MLSDARTLLANRTSPRDAVRAQMYRDRLTTWENIQKTYGVTMEDLVACIAPRSNCSLIEFAGRQNEALRRWMETAVPDATQTSLNRVRQVQSLLRNNIERLTNNAKRGITGAVSCMNTYSQMAQSNAPLNDVPKLGGGPIKGIIAGSAAAAGGVVALKAYQEAKAIDRELAETQALINSLNSGGSSSGSTSTSSGGSTSTTTTTTYSATGTYSCTPGSGASEPCNRAVASGGCDPFSISFTVTGSTVRDNCNWLIGSVSGSTFTDRYTGTSSTTLPMSGTLPGAGSSTQWTGTETYRGNAYRIVLTVTRR